jgi:hypothetical protein
LAPGCYLATIVNNNIGTTFVGEYVYCGTSVSQSFSVSSGTSASFCTQDQKIDLPPNETYYTASFGPVGSCAATTTTTTTIAPGCYSYSIINNSTDSTFIGSYVECGTDYTASYSIPSQTTASLCVLDQKINLPSGPNYTSSFTGPGTCVGTTTTTSTTTTTLAPTTTTTTVVPFCSVWTASNAFGAGYEIRVKYCGDVSYSFPTVPANSSIYVCVQNDQIDNNGNPITLYSSSVACTGSIITTTTTTSTTTTSTTTTTTAAPTTTTTTTLASQKYYVESCAGPGDIVGVIEITNAPLLTSKIIRVNTPVASVYSCFQVFSTSTATPLLGTRSVTNIYTDCVDCTD